ncbi:saccharopine dehydrogenase [Kiloniella spongiae]|uniref:Saccharopine dehydrogenase n=1 Tax=Kiloniella spongiae TaxID=1489064 RepID=A0A0H2MBP9_9PROT|nr:saccharopine dehydrogenase family protein [Kiloniella spongiae]KLN59949.1 saccharopine dehydrogenase [Kiloniella spongiae]
MARIHWLGAGLSTVPGIRRLIERGQSVTVWNRTVEKAQDATKGLSGDFDIKAFSLEALESDLKKGDLAVSMLPGDFHVAVAQMCLNAGANFVSSSYIAPEMRALDAVAKEKGLTLVNEVGLDPGIDHLMAHVLMDDYKNSPAFAKGNAHYFRSYCGGLSEKPNDFCYKFSWAPLGVLKALRSPSKSLRDGNVYDVNRPWDAVESYEIDLEKGSETFEVYPNRDSYPFMDEYGFGKDWNVQQFVRGTLRYGGWSTAWSDLFREIETLEGEAGDKRLAEISADLWDKYALVEGEHDRVVLSVDLWAERNGEQVYNKSYVMDAYGDDNHTAMARLVSTPVSYAVEAVLKGEIAPGVSAAPSDVTVAKKWLEDLQVAGEKMAIVDRLA